MHDYTMRRYAESRENFINLTEEISPSKTGRPEMDFLFRGSVGQASLAISAAVSRATSIIWVKELCRSSAGRLSSGR